MNKLKRVKLIFTPFINLGNNAAGVELVTPATGKFDKANFVAVFCKEEGNAEFKYICEFDNGGQFPNQAMDRARDYIQAINEELIQLYALADVLEQLKESSNKLNAFNTDIIQNARNGRLDKILASTEKMLDCVNISDWNQNVIYSTSVTLEMIDNRARGISGWTPAAPLPIDNKEDL